jgi:hypothetical protein
LGSLEVCARPWPQHEPEFDRLGKETAKSLDADAILATTTRMVGEHLGLSSCAYADMDADCAEFTIRSDWAAPGVVHIVGHYSLADFGKLAVKNLSAGQPLIVNDNLDRGGVPRSGDLSGHRYRLDDLLAAGQGRTAHSLDGDPSQGTASVNRR